MRGDGSIYQRGRIWWAEYAGQCESLKTTDKEEAKKRLQKIRKAKERGAYFNPTERRTTVTELLDDLQDQLDTDGTDKDRCVFHTLKAVRAAFGHMKAAEVTTKRVREVQKEWLAEGYANATVNRRCERLKQAFRIAHAATPPKVKLVPFIPALPMHNARQGYVSAQEFAAILAHVPDPDVRDFLEWFYSTGMRPREIQRLTWDMFHADTWTINLDPAAAKTKKGRSLGLADAPRAIIERRLKRSLHGCPLIFHRKSKGKVGQPIKDYSDTWRAACIAAKVRPGLIPYDLRRTAVRNLIRSGVSRDVAMAISGHTSDQTFRRYNITDEADTRAAFALVARAARKEKTTKPAPKLSTVAPTDYPMTTTQAKRARKAKAS